MSRTSTQSRTVSLSYETIRARLIGWAMLMAVIYAVYVIAFPLTPTIYQNDHILEIEQLLRHGRRWFALFYVLGLLTLFLAFWQILRLVHTFSKANPPAADALRTWVLGIGVLSGMMLVGLYPITALDVALYVVRARLWAFYGESPMLAVPANFPQDPYIGLSGEYDREVSPYGPVWELIAQVPIRLGLFEIGTGILAMKVISLLSYIGMALLIGWHARTPRTRLLQQDGISPLTAMTFFALNPLVLLEAIGNGHNDILMLALMTLGLVLWQRDRWAWAMFVLTLSTLVKITGLIFMPLSAVAVLVGASTWKERIKRGLGMAAIFIITAGVAYRLMGPFPGVFEGARHALFDRWGYTPAYLIDVVAQEIYPNENVIRHILTQGTHVLFILYFAYLLIRLAQGKMTLVQAGFLAYFSQLLLGPTFRIWYPLWLIPFAALELNSRTFWRTFLFSITAELSILMYLIVWRWGLDEWKWALNGPLKEYWAFRTVMTSITAPWVFGAPLLGPLLHRRKDPKRFDDTLWI